MKEKITINDMGNEISLANSHFSAHQVIKATKIILDNIAESLRRGERVEIRGFGTFTPVMKASYVAKNPKSGEKFVCDYSAKVRFKAGEKMRHSLL